jgi:hypothetical protein
MFKWLRKGKSRLDINDWIGSQSFQASRLSVAQILLLEAYYQPERYYYQGRLKGHSWDEWKKALKFSPKGVIDGFLMEGLLIETTLEEKVAYQFKVAELKTFLKREGLKVSGRKADLAARLVSIKPDLMIKKTSKLNLLKCSESGKEIVDNFRSQQQSDFETTIQDALSLLHKMDFIEAVKVVHDYEAKQVFTRGINVDWGHPLSITSDIDFIKLIFESHPSLLESVSEHKMIHLRVAASMFHLGVGNRGDIKKWLPSDFEISSPLDPENATLYLFNHSAYKRDLREGASFKKVSLTSWDNNECNACQSVAGRKYKIKDVPELPPDGCKFPSACRIQISFDLEDLNLDDF